MPETLVSLCGIWRREFPPLTRYHDLSADNGALIVT